MASLLLVEDSPDCQILVREILGPIAEIHVAATIQEARERLAKQRYDLIVMDLQLPDGDGIEFFTTFKEETPVMFLTSRAESTTQVTAFSLGAEDYVVKPIKPLEFRARVEAKLKKISNKKSASTTLRRGALRIELGAQRAFVQVEGQEDRELELTGREFKLLYHLAKNEGTVFSRDELIGAIWGTGVHVLDRTVDTHIYTLRKKLGTFSAYIQSEIGSGYRLNSTAKATPTKIKKAA